MLLRRQRSRAPAANSAALTARLVQLDAVESRGVARAAPHRRRARTLSMTSRASAAMCVAGRLRRAAPAPRAARASSSVCQSRMRIGSGQHLLDRQHQQRAGAGLLQALERLPEHVLAAHRVHGHPIGRALERNDGRRLAARQQLADLAAAPQRGACSMMYLLSRTCCTPSMRMQQPLAPIRPSRAAESSGVRISTAWLSSTVSTSRR